MRGDSNERLTILSEAEKTALYGIPDFDDFQRIEFLVLSQSLRFSGNWVSLRELLKQQSDDHGFQGQPV